MMTADECEVDAFQTRPEDSSSAQRNYQIPARDMWLRWGCLASLLVQVASLGEWCGAVLV